MERYHTGDAVIFRMGKVSQHPGPRAQDVDAAPRGELYSYVVDKFWVVADIRPDGQILVKTRRGKQRVIEQDDTRLRPARWWERLLYRDRFPRLESLS